MAALDAVCGKPVHLFVYDANHVPFALCRDHAGQRPTGDAAMVVVANEDDTGNCEIPLAGLMDVLHEALDQRQRIARLAHELRSRAVVQEAGAKQRAVAKKDPHLWRTSDVVRLMDEIADRLDCIANGTEWNPRRPVLPPPDSSPVFDSRKPRERMDRSRADREPKERAANEVPHTDDD